MKPLESKWQTQKELIANAERLAKDSVQCVTGAYLQVSCIIIENYNALW